MTKKNLEAAARAGSVAHMIRGGRLVKRKGQVLSFAPHVGQLCSVSCGALAAGLALGVSLLGAAPASAGTCDPLAPPFDPNGAAVTCSGPADQANDVTQEIVGQQLTVTTAPGFGISTSAGDGLSLTIRSGYNSGLTFVDTNAIASQITAAETAIDAYAVGRSSITTNATIKGGTYGVKFAVGSVGSLTITATGSVEGTTYDGINAALTGEARDMTVRAADVTGGRTGIDVVNKAYGSTFVGSSNSVTAINGIGIIVNNENPRTENLTVDVVNVSGKAGGIEVGNNGTGATSVSSSGEVYSSNGDGISAYNDASATDITIIANDVDAKNTGILARNLGKGNTRIDSISYIKAGGDGISATNEIDAGDLTITAVKVEAGDDGIVASNFGKGATSVTATGDIVGAFSGINVANAVNAVTYTSNTTDLTVNAVNVTGGEYGIIASNQGNGETYIKSTGSVSANSATGTGISVSSGQFTTGLTIKANDVNGGKDGIDADHSGRGNLTITTDGLVQGLDGFGIDAYNGSAGSDLTILANGDVSALLDGISVYNNGIGNTSVTAFGTVEAGKVGISVLNGLDAFDLKVSANIVTASGDFGIGIFAYNTGKGSTSVTATGAITANGDSYNGIYGDSGRGIYVFNSSTAENLEIIALDTVTGGDTGITAKNNGSGSTSIAASGLVTGNGINSGGGAGTGASGDGIYAYNAPSAGALTVSAIDVTADKNGISVFNKGTGATTVSSTGVVTGGVHGIYTKSDGTATGLTINANIVNGGEDGIVASNTGRGATFVSASGAVNGTTGFGIYAKNITSGTDLTIDVETDVTGGTTGIFAVNNGTGVTLINTTGPNLLGGGTVTGIAGNGIDVLNEVGASHLIVEVANVTGATNGIKAVSKGDGSYTSITATGTVKGTGANSDGINALSGTGTDYLKIVTNSVEGVDDGIDAQNDGNGFTTITANGLVKGGVNGNGIEVNNAPTATALTVDAAAVTGGVNGIFAKNDGTGPTFVSASGVVSGTTADGIYAATAGLNLTINTTAAVTGGDDGIDAKNDGAGFTLITAIGNVEGKGTRDGIGISAVNAGTASSLEIKANNANTVQAGGIGISAQNLGNGATAVSSTGNVIGAFFDGINAVNSGTTLTIDVNSVTGGEDGIDAQNNGDGFALITANGLVKGGVNGNGINVINAASATALTVDAAAVTGGENGIFAENLGTGVTVVTATGLVGGTATDGYTTADGIHVSNTNAGNTAIPAGQTVAPLIGMQVSVQDVNGGVNGIFADHNGAGGLVISADGTVNGRSADGINANNSTAGTYLSVTTAAVTGGINGIFAENAGDGFTLITATGTVTGQGTYGIYAKNDTSATDLTISAAVVTGDENGIFALNNGTGATLVSASGAVTGTTSDGIYAKNGGTDLTVDTTAAVTGDYNGIYARNRGSGATFVSASGAVTGTGANGIHAKNDGTNLTVNTTAEVTGDDNGIVAENLGTGATLISASGDVSGGTGFGIYAQNGDYAQNIAGGTDLTIDVEADVTGGTSGIFAVNNGSGVTLINTTGPNLLGGGTVTGYAGNGIDVLNEVGASDLIIEAASVTGSEYGIKAVNKSDNGGSTSITATGDVLGETEEGIYALNEVGTTDLTITATGKVKGDVDGISAENLGTGATFVSASGAVTGTTTDGIYIKNDGTDLTVSAAAVTGNDNGIYARNIGTGATLVSASGAVTGTTADGIFATTAGTNLTINTTAAVTGRADGIDAQNNGDGFTLITASGLVTGGVNGNGIEVNNAASATDLKISAAAVTGGVNGIYAENLGTGTTIITATGLVGGTAADGYTTADGIHVTNSALGNTAIPTGQTVAPIIGTQVSAHDVNGGVNGIFADHNGAGGLIITADGSVNGRSADGINANNSTLGTYLSVTTATVTGGVNGIYAVHNGTGNTVVTASGSVNGATGVGIVATALNTNGGELRITAKSASGLLGGIVAQNDGAGASTVSVTGTIAGGDGAGIETSTLAGNLTTVNLATTAIIGATSGKAIANNDGNSILNVSANAVINGTVELDGGTDTASFARNGTLATISLLDGGDNVASADGSVDTLNLNGVDDFNLVGANTVNWEVININGGTIGFSDARILAETINVNNRATLNGANSLVATANVNIAEGAALTAGNAGGTAATRITGNLVNAGLLNLSGSTAVGRAGDTLSVAGNYTGVAAQVRLDTVLNGDNSPTDLLNVAGNVTGSSLLTVNNAGGIGGLTTGDGIRIVQVGGASAQDGFVLLDELKAGAFRYDLFLGGVTDPNDQDWYLRTVGLSDVAATTLSFARLSDDIAMTFLGTLHERVGEQEHLAKRGYQSGGVSGIWGRFVGKGFREKLTSPTLGDVKSTGSITGLQMGLDFVRNIKGDGSATFAGVYSGYADGNASDKNIFQGVARRSGTSDSKGWLTGLYGTHYSSAGWYANVVLQANWVDASANGRDGTVLKTDGRTYLGSFELGQSLKLVDRLAFEPQLQLIYGDTQFDAATDSSGIENRVGIESSLIGRAGFRLKTTKSEKYNAEGGLFSGYLKANLWHNLSGADVELFSAGQPVGGFEPKKTWVDVGLGTTLTVAKNTEIYFDADVEFGLDIKNTAGRGNVGLRFNW